MNEQFFFADVDLPFHFWVRERFGASGVRWVLREAPQADTAPGDVATSLEQAPTSSPEP